MIFSSGPGPQSMAKPPSGLFLYVSTLAGLYAYWINPTNGALVGVTGSPFFSDVPGRILFADPAGNFLYATQAVPTVTGKEPTSIINSYKIDRSTGALSASSSTTVPQLRTTLSSDIYGQFLYATGAGTTTDPSHVYGYSVNPNTGALTPVYGSPFVMSDTQYAFALSAAYQYLYVATATNNGDIRSYQINYNSGWLYPPLGPYAAPSVPFSTQAMLADWLARYVWTVNNPTSNGQYSFSLFDLDGYTGALSGPYPDSAGTLPIQILTESNEANAVYAAGGSCGPVSCTPGEVSAWKLAGDGTPQLLNSLPMGSSNPVGIAVIRMHPE